MKIVNRGFITIAPKQAFWDWANQFEDDVVFSEADEVEPNVYLITEDFFEIEPLIEQNFKKIFNNELAMITENEKDWPENRTLELFLTLFTLEIGSTVFDLEKTGLTAEKID
ncbi:MAG: hypothetical protein KA521_10135 [Crocinitomicaceae bacterium]|nr:hypothetical protein [Crocinitomicaceae bacterium]